MNQVEKSVIEKVSKVLESLNLKFAIMDSDGNKHGALEVIAKKKRCRSIYPLGEMRAYILPHVKDMMINTVKHVPVGKYDPVVVRGSVSSYATQAWGSGNYKTSITKDRKSVEVMRLDPTVSEFMKNDPLGDLFSELNMKPQRLTREEFRASS